MPVTADLASSVFAVSLSGLVCRYGQRVAVDNVTWQTPAGKTVGLLGPNGSGKSTIFRVLATLMPPAAGTARIFGHDVTTERLTVRRLIGTIFQSPSLDKELTAEENLRYHGRLFGLSGTDLDYRVDSLMATLDLGDRANDRAKHLSGGLRRRVEIAKGLLPDPKLLLMDEPTVGIDPAARRQVWALVKRVQEETGLSVLVTTHLMDEAADCDELAMMHRGKLVATGTPAELTSQLGGDVIIFTGDDPERLAAAIREKFASELEGNVELHDGRVRLRRREGHRLVPQVIEALPGLVREASVGKPTLDDVFLHLTGSELSDT